MGFVIKLISIKSPRVIRHANSSQRHNGFTLLELLVVMVIIGITLGAVAFNTLPSEHQVLKTDAERVALLLQLAREEAIVRNRPIAFEAGSMSFRFLKLEANQWQVLNDDELLRQREFKSSPVLLSISPSLAVQTMPLRIIFGHEPVGTPFSLTLSVGDSHVSIHADGIGHFEVE